MERVFSVEEITDPFWASSPAPSAGDVPTGAGTSRGPMNRSPSEWFFEKFLEEAALRGSSSLPSTKVAGNPCPHPDSNPNTSVSSKRGVDDDVVEIKTPLQQEADPPADVDPGEYAALLKKKLDMYCAAVAMSRGTSVQLQDSSLANSSLASQASHFGSQAPINGANADDGILATQAIAVVQNSVVQGKPANSGSSREQSDDDEGEGEVETNDSMDPADAKRFRRLF